MNSPQNYRNALAFKAALEQRLRNESQKQERPYPVLRKLVAFERLLVRVFTTSEQSWALKGGYALELRLGKARTTKDLDLVINSLTLMGETKNVEPQLLRSLIQKEVSKDLGDYFAFRLGEPAALKAATIAGVGIPVESLIGGYTFENFRLDLAVAETDPSPFEKIVRPSWLAFAGFEEVSVFAIPESLQFAEKLHAYTFQWTDRENTRVKDLIDMVLMIQRGISANETVNRITAVFQTRKTHAIPVALEIPPKAWRATFDKAAEEAGFSGNLDEAFAILKSFFETLDNQQLLS